jgi:hypothetical protein
VNPAYSGICALIEFWKLQKALKVKVHLEGGWKPIIEFGEMSEQEKQTGTSFGNYIKKMFRSF